MSHIGVDQLSTKPYDLIIVGSGAAGGMSAYVLTHQSPGMRVLMIEAGRNYDPKTETKMFETPKDAKLRDSLYIPGKSHGEFEAAEGGWELKNEPYTVKDMDTDSFVTAKDVLYGPDDTKQAFSWYRMRMLGGRTNHWGRTSLRFGAIDFKPYSFDGQGVNWPVSYAEMKPYYDRVDQIVGILGSVEGLENNPDSDYFLKPPQPRAIDHIFKKAVRSLGRPVIPKRAAILTKPHADRAACINATDCRRGCSIGAAFQSPTALLNPSIEKGNLDIITNCMVREVTTNSKGEATGVSFIDKMTGKEQTVFAKTIVLGASSLSSVQILLNSQSPRHPQGIGNSTGHLGKWIMDSTGVWHGRAQIPALENLPPHNEDGISISHSYSPWVNWKELKSGRLGFSRGYYMTWNGGRKMPTYKSISKIMNLSADTYGTQMKEEARRYFGTLFSFYTPGEMIPNAESFCEIDPKLKDSWGIPSLRIHYKMGEQENNQMKHKVESVKALVDAAGGNFYRGGVVDPVLEPGGADHHEVGGARMSARPSDGVTNSWGQVWDCPNVVVVDGALFASSSYKNPTLTIMAFALRATEGVLNRLKQRNS